MNRIAELQKRRTEAAAEIEAMEVLMTSGQVQPYSQQYNFIQQQKCGLEQYKSGIVAEICDLLQRTAQGVQG